MFTEGFARNIRGLADGDEKRKNASDQVAV